MLVAEAFINCFRDAHVVMNMHVVEVGRQSPYKVEYVKVVLFSREVAVADVEAEFEVLGADCLYDLQHLVGQYANSVYVFLPIHFLQTQRQAIVGSHM